SDAAAATLNIIENRRQRADAPAVAGGAAGSELEVDELIVRIVADLEQDKREGDRRKDGEHARRRRLVHGGPGGRTDQRNGGGDGDGAPFQTGANRGQPQHTL